MSVKTVFDKYSSVYDCARRKLIPCFDDFYGIAVDIIPFPREESIKALDLGAGTGILSEMVAREFPASEIHLMDVSGKMLLAAKRRLQRYDNIFRYVIADYVHESFDEKFDVIISALSIHHLSCSEKDFLFMKCYELLNPGGVFINADQILGETPAIELHYRRRWVEEVKNNGVTANELKAAFERMKEDKTSTLSYQFDCLAKAGFVEVNCWYKNYSFVVFSGSKANDNIPPS